MNLGKVKGRQDGNEFGVALCTIDGQEIAEGDAFLDIPLMETVKPLLYALAMEDSGIDEVHRYVGIEPTSSDPTGFDLLQPTSHGVATTIVKRSQHLTILSQIAVD